MLMFVFVSTAARSRILMMFAYWYFDISVEKHTSSKHSSLTIQYYMSIYLLCQLESANFDQIYFYYINYPLTLRNFQIIHLVSIDVFIKNYLSSEILNFRTEIHL